MKIKHLFWIIPLVLVVSLAGTIGIYTVVKSQPIAPVARTDVEQLYFEKMLEESYAERLVRKLPYETTDPSLFLYAKAGIIIDASNGCILFEKNADALIPPASMTKIAVMYVTFQAINNGETTLDTVVDLPPEAWAKNAPLQSSIMGLAQHQIVTVHELLLGLSVASGNDAGTALACHISGSVEKFCDRMNKEMEYLGLTNTRFVDASGYSELNMTTPKEFAALARAYITKYPQALKDYHSASNMVFPTRENYPKNYTGIINTRNMYATNKLLDIIEGCDGLKTGFIYESGYNISLTAKQGNTRFISVTMGGPGIGSAEGNKYRVADGKTLMNWAFSTFETSLEQEAVSMPIRVWQGKANAIFAEEAQSHALTVPHVSENAASKVVRNVTIAESVTAPVKAGDRLGTVRYTLDGIVLEEIPLVADRDVLESNVVQKTLDKVAKVILQKLKR